MSKRQLTFNSRGQLLKPPKLDDTDMLYDECKSVCIIYNLLYVVSLVQNDQSSEVEDASKKQDSDDTELLHENCELVLILTP